MNIRKEIEKTCREFRQGLTYYENEDTLVSHIESLCDTYRQLNPLSKKTFKDLKKNDEV